MCKPLISSYKGSLVQTNTGTATLFLKVHLVKGNPSDHNLRKKADLPNECFMATSPEVDSRACLCRVDAGLKTVTGGKKYVPSTKLDGCKLRVYDAGAGSWRRHIDSKLHLGSSRALEAAALVPLNGKICIVRNNMSITLVDVEARDGAGSGDQRWETIAGKGQLKTFVTNLLSNIVGRSSNRSYIVHCQVLQA
ncbi:hypothetical protein C4D60_Mb02t17690 [Musa balbisiana]|uniref:Uncharacterized protein n=1 Tax=Musa balbisiana TaxID=52838 RepID=A0A4S8IBH3_MUSBA|nr:hypothetical protein C4D60_Mb02t17690 [Musa balbisiana]